VSGGNNIVITSFSGVAMRHILIVLSIVLCANLVLAGESSFRLAPLFTDNMVMQQQTSAPLWGRGTPGDTIVVRTSWGEEGATVVTPDSAWLLHLKTPSAGGPARIEIRHDHATLYLSNILIGEVWLCSGQSNMEMPLAGFSQRDTIANAAREISNALLMPTVRMFTVRRAFSPTPEATCEGSWVDCYPATAPSFSATAYFFGKALQHALNVPVGLIHSSWGGTAVECWMSGKQLSGIAGYDSILQKIQVSVDSLRMLNAYLARLPVFDMHERGQGIQWRDITFHDSACAMRNFADSSWDRMTLPTFWEQTPLGQFDGVVWFRKQVTIPPGWVHHDLVLNLGPIDDMDATFVNGVKVGGLEEEGMWTTNRTYAVPASLVDSTLMEIAVRVIDLQGGGGIYGNDKLLSLSVATGIPGTPLQSGVQQHIALAGTWKYLPVAELRNQRFYIFGTDRRLFDGRPRLPIDLSGYSPTVLYNAMIVPLAPFALRGVIWYQGEANTPNPGLYRTLFPAMIENWRETFENEKLPFYYVQIAPYQYGPATHSELLREAQRATLKVPNTGMAVTLDIGNPDNIHPADKQDVGKRLALWALAKTYNRKVAYSGPLYKAMKKRKGSIELTFDDVGKGLVLKAGPEGNGFQIAGPDSVFRNAIVRIREKSIIVSHPDIKNPLAVRYAFSNAASATLFNRDGLPASSFRTDDWDR
jgi:sialate O-acetylesterase